MLHKLERSDSSHAILDQASRTIKARKIIALLKSEGIDLAKSTVLDIGTGAGIITQDISREAKATVGVDVTDERKVTDGFDFVLVENEQLPFENQYFDVVISNHIIEHVGDQELHIREMLRVVKDGGVIYLATPNKYWITDPHYKIPFVNWMSESMASVYISYFRKADWDIKPVSEPWITNRVAAQCRVRNLVPKLTKNPEAFSLDTGSVLHPLVKLLPLFVLHILAKLSPTIILALHKNKN